MFKNGFSLLEVLLSLAIFSIGLLGLLKLQTISMQSAYASMLRAQGQIQLTNFAEELMLPVVPDIATWQMSNAGYLPLSQSRLTGNQIRLVWQTYGEVEGLTLRVTS
jgi:prepilin-type N-terminal cleavage/methylation domain-containing protein